MCANSCASNASISSALNFSRNPGGSSSVCFSTPTVAGPAILTDSANRTWPASSESNRCSLFIRMAGSPEISKGEASRRILSVVHAPQPSRPAK